MCLRNDMFYEFLNATFNDISLAENYLKKDPKLIYATNGIGETVLHYLSIENMLKEVKWIYNKGANINTTNNFGDTPLKEAASLGLLDICKFLVEMGADHKIKNDNGDTALSDAAINNQIKVVHFLLDLIQPNEKLSNYFDSITYDILLDKNSPCATAIAEKGLKPTLL